MREYLKIIIDGRNVSKKILFGLVSTGLLIGGLFFYMSYSMFALIDDLNLLWQNIIYFGGGDVPQQINVHLTSLNKNIQKTLIIGLAIWAAVFIIGASIMALISKIAAEFKKKEDELRELNTGLEKRIKKSTRELERSNNLKELFIDILGHDMLNYASVVRGMTEEALKREKDIEKKEILQTALQGTNKIIELVDYTSLLTTLEIGKDLPLDERDLGGLLKEAIKHESENAREKNIQLTADIEGENPAMVNPLIQNVFSNIISNAIKYGPENSTVEIKLEKTDNSYTVAVADQGETIPKKHRTEIFNRFTRVKKGYVKGSGLGLAIVSRIVELHNGRVWAEENPGGGNIFYVELPIS